MQNPAYQAYIRNKVLTATPEQLQLMLYEGAIRFANMAKLAIEERDAERKLTAFDRVHGILCELHAGLRPDLDPDLCDKFASLYNFCSRKLLEANFRNDPAALDDALGILHHLRETWVMVLQKISQEQASGMVVERESGTASFAGHG